MKLGVFVRRECWTLSWRGKTIALALLVILLFVVGRGAYPFLAANHPEDGEMMILEGWISPYFLSDAAAEFKRGRYRTVLVLQAIYNSQEDTLFKDPSGRISDEYSSRMLVKYGVPREAVEAVLYPGVEKDRTYHGALAAREWLSKNGPWPKRFNVVTVGPHARRSWLMFAKAFGNTAEAGVVPLNDPMYDPKHWWRTSEGVREILGEGIAYVYARFFFSWTH